MLCLNSAADVLILLSLPLEPHISMANALIVVALVGIGAYVVHRLLRSPSTRGIDIGVLSDGWIAERRREEP